MMPPSISVDGQTVCVPRWHEVHCDRCLRLVQSTSAPAGEAPHGGAKHASHAAE